MDLTTKKAFIVLLGTSGIMLILLANYLNFESTNQVFLIAANFHNTSQAYLAAVNMNLSFLPKTRKALQDAVHREATAYDKSLKPLQTNRTGLKMRMRYGKLRLNAKSLTSKYVQMDRNSSILYPVVKVNDTKFHDFYHQKRKADDWKQTDLTNDNVRSQTKEYLTDTATQKIIITTSSTTTSSTTTTTTSREAKYIISKTTARTYNSDRNSNRNRSAVISFRKPILRHDSGNIVNGSVGRQYKKKIFLQENLPDHHAPNLYHHSMDSIQQDKYDIKSIADISHSVAVRPIQMQRDNMDSIQQDKYDIKSIADISHNVAVRPIQMQRDNMDSIQQDKYDIKSIADISHNVEVRPMQMQRDNMDSIQQDKYDIKSIADISHNVEVRPMRNQMESIVPNNAMSIDDNGRQSAENTSSEYLTYLTEEGFFLDQDCVKRRTGVEDILCMKRPEFLPDFRNPCWYQNSMLRCLPYFYIIGVCKTGTTDLFERLSHHPQIIKNKGILGKETWYWTWQRYGHSNFHNTLTYRKSFDDFIDKFDAQMIEEVTRNLPNGSVYHPLVTGHGDPMDFWDQASWHLIPQNDHSKDLPEVTTAHLVKHVNPNVKLILLVRDPVERLFSNYLHGQFGFTSQEFHDDVLTSLSMLTSCRRTRTLKACLYDENMIRRLPTPISGSFYSVHLKEWLKVFSRDQMFITTTEDFSRNIPKTLLQVFRFLKLDPIPTRDLYRIASMPHFYNTKGKQSAGEIIEETREMLNAVFKPYNQELVDILHDEKFNFNTNR